MTVLLTGGAGYIGSHTALTLLEEGWDVVVADNLANSSAESLRRVEEITGRKLRFYEMDIADRSALRRVFEENDIAAVIHFAGLKAVGESVKEPLRYYRVNLDATLSLLECMAEYKTRSIVFSSSATVYGEGTPPFIEGVSPRGCTNPYGWTKYMIEQIITDAAAANGFSAVLLRYFNPVGAHPSGRIGEDPQGVPNNLMPYIAQVACGRREKLTVFGGDYPTPDGSCIRDYIHICDLAEGHSRALSYALEHEGVEAINLGRGKGVSVLELVHAWEAANEMELPHVIGARRPGDIPENYADASLAEKLLGWRATRSVEDMCRYTWNWQRNNPYGYGSAD